MVLEIENPYKERFLAGFCQAGAPFSLKVNDNNLKTPLRLKAREYFSDESLNFWDDNWAESFCYFSGGLVGLTMIPIDALLTGVFTVRKTISGIV